MSRENVEIVRRAFELKVRGRGGDAELAAFHPDVVINSVEEGPSYGLNAIRGNLERWASVWEELGGAWLKSTNGTTTQARPTFQTAARNIRNKIG